MDKDTNYRIVGGLLIVLCALLVIFVDLSKVLSIFAGLCIGAGISLLTRGRNIRNSWHY